MDELKRNALFNRTHQANEDYIESINSDASAEDQECLLKVCNHYMNEICRSGLASEYRSYVEINY